MYEPSHFEGALCCVYCLTLCLPSLLYNADNESGAETHQILLLLLVMRSYANIGAAPRVNPDNCITAEYENTQLQRGESTATEITIYFVFFLFEAKT